MVSAALEQRLRAATLSPGDRPSQSSDFDLAPEAAPAAARQLRPAGVLVAVLTHATRPMLLLTKRSSAMRHHPGQIALPGGKQDVSDPDVIATALREAQEEVGLPVQSAEILGLLPPHETITGFRVHPVLALVRKPFTPRLEPGEVAEVFTVPLSHILDLNNFSARSRRWRRQRRGYLTVPYGPYYIWGATARILHTLATRAAA